MEVEESVLNRLNDILGKARLGVSIEIGDNEEFVARRADGETYSAAEMSDGERNAVILTAHTLTVEAETLIVIDEPDKHLHRSVIEPLISALLESST